jgi:hypothetical protein
MHLAPWASSESGARVEACHARRSFLQRRNPNAWPVEHQVPSVRIELSLSLCSALVCLLTVFFDLLHGMAPRRHNHGKYQLKMLLTLWPAWFDFRLISSALELHSAASFRMMPRVSRSFTGLRRDTDGLGPVAVLQCALGVGFTHRCSL